jgi:hypothetical protein
VLQISQSASLRLRLSEFLYILLDWHVKMAINSHGPAFEMEAGEKPEVILTGYDGEDFILLETPILGTSAHSEENGLEFTDVLVLAWASLLYRYNGSNEIQINWGYNKIEGSNSLKLVESADVVTVENQQSLSSLLESIRTMRKASVISSHSLEQPDTNGMFFNNTSTVKSGGSANVGILSHKNDIMLRKFH